MDKGPMKRYNRGKGVIAMPKIDAQLGIRVTKDLKARLERQAKRCGLSLSGYLRRVGAGKSAAMFPGQRYAYDLGYQRYKPVPVQRPRPRRLRLNVSFSTVKKIGGFRGLYLHYCYCLGILLQGRGHRP